MKIGLIDVDNHDKNPKFPNLALMKISAWHRQQGDTVEWWNGFMEYDRVYMSKVFSDVFTKDLDFAINAKEIIKGGSGYQIETMAGKESYRSSASDLLPHEIEHIYPDYSIYPMFKDTAYGFLTRGCPRGCSFCHVAAKEGRKSVKVADLNEFWDGQKNIVLMDPNLLACKDRLELLDQLADSGAKVDINQGLDIRLCGKDVVEKLNKIRIKILHFAWDNPSDKLEPFFERFTERYDRKDPSRKIVYVLTNYGETMKQNLYRIYTLKNLGYNPYVMIYNKPSAPKEIKRLQRWCNNRIIFGSCERFEDYEG